MKLFIKRNSFYYGRVDKNGDVLALFNTDNSISIEELEYFPPFFNISYNDSQNFWYHTEDIDITNIPPNILNMINLIRGL